MMSIRSRDKSLRGKCLSPRSLKWEMNLITGRTHEGVWKGETQQGSVSVFCELYHEHTWMTDSECVSEAEEMDGSF